MATNNKEIKNKNIKVKNIKNEKAKKIQQGGNKLENKELKAISADKQTKITEPLSTTKNANKDQKEIKANTKKISLLQKLKNNKLTILAVILSIITMFYYIDKKQGYHEDEMFSYGSSNYKYDNVYRNYGYAQGNMDILYREVLSSHDINKLITFLKDIPSNNYPEFSKNETLFQEIPTWKSNEDAHDYLTIGQGDILNYRSTYINQAFDVHPPLFYFCMHLVSSIFYGKFTKYIGFTLNMIFFLGTLYFLDKICKRLGKKKISAPTILLYGLSMGAISTVSFHRMYMMLTFFSIWYFYLTVDFIKNNSIIKKKWPWIICILGGFLTQYYFCIYIVLMFILNAIYLIFKKEYQKTGNYLLVHVIPAVIGIAFYPVSIYQIFFSYRGFGAEDTGRSLLTNLKYYNNAILKMFSLEKIFTLIICFLFLGMGYFFGKNKRFQDKKILLSLFVPMIFFILVVSKIAPFLGENYTSRYIMLLFPSFALLLVYLFNTFYDNKYFSILSMAIILGISLVGFKTSTPVYLYADYAKSLELARDNKITPFIYVYDNYFTHLSSMPEFNIYEKHLILNNNIYDYSLLKNDDVLKSSASIIVCVKNWLDKDSVIQKILANTDYQQEKEILYLNSDIESTYYLLTK